MRSSRTSTVARSGTAGVNDRYSSLWDDSGFIGIGMRLITVAPNTFPSTFPIGMTRRSNQHLPTTIPSRFVRWPLPLPIWVVEVFSKSPCTLAFGLECVTASHGSTSCSTRRSAARSQPALQILDRLLRISSTVIVTPIHMLTATAGTR